MNEPTNIPESLHRDDRRQWLKDRFKFQHVNEITGTFVILIVLALIAAVVWMGHSQRWFKSKVALRITLPEAGAAGIRQGSEVYFLGTLVGSVSDVIVDEASHMEAEAKIRHDFFRFVRADSSAVIKRKFGVAGDSFFEITRGEGRPLSEDNAVIVCKEQFQSALEAAVEQVRGEAMLVLKKVNGGLDTWTTLGSNLITSSARLDQLVADVQTGKGAAGKLLADPATADALQVTLNNFQNASTNLPAISDALANEAKDLPGLVLQTQTSMRELERLIEAIQKNWLVRKHINPTNPPSLQPISKNKR